MTPGVAIVGGGPAGAAVAITLARRGVAATVIEQAAEPAAKPGECLPPTANRTLELLGVRRALAADPAHLSAPGTRAAWGGPEPLDHDFIGSRHGQGWQLDRAALERLLFETASELGVTWRWGSRLANLVRTCNGWRLQLDGASLRVAFVVDATGRRATLARRFGAERVAYDRLLAIGTVLEPNERAADARVLVEAVPNGWWYTAGLADGRLVVTFFTDADVAHSTVAAWCAELRQAPRTWERVAERFEVPRRLSVVSASSSRLTQIVGANWLAVGDAAAAHDPLASYGLLAALGGGIYAGQAIADYLAGDSLAPAAYVRLQQDAYARYLEGCVATYATETRWPRAPFWSRRALIAS